MNAPLVELRLKVKVTPGTYNTESIRGQNPIKAVVIGDSDAPEYVYLELQNGVALFYDLVNGIAFTNDEELYQELKSRHENQE